MKVLSEHSFTSFLFYQSFIEISKGESDKFEEYLSRIRQYYLQEIEDELDSEDETIQKPLGSQTEVIDLEKLLKNRIKVMPGMRWQVFQRDNWKCVACGRTSEDDIILHVDHIIPRSKGGQNTISNYQTLCNICNIGKSNKDSTDIRTER